MAFKDTLLQFLKDLERLDDKYPDMRDSDVQDYIWETLAYYLIHMQDGSGGVRPTMYGMTTKEGDEDVTAAVNRFINNARKDQRFRAQSADERLNTLQDASVETETGSVYSDFIGHHSVPGPVIEMVEARFQDSPYYGTKAPLTPGRPAKARINPIVLMVSLGITLLIGIGIIVMIVMKSSPSGTGTPPRSDARPASAIWASMV